MFYQVVDIELEEPFVSKYGKHGQVMNGITRSIINLAPGDSCRCYLIDYERYLQSIRVGYILSQSQFEEYLIQNGFVDKPSPPSKEESKPIEVESTEFVYKKLKINEIDFNDPDFQNRYNEYSTDISVIVLNELFTQCAWKLVDVIDKAKGKTND
jgi:hypothetical protein